ncbi:hypothetical protein ADUPG1_007219 [Aduncisulcus paluster]|uniref:Sulphur transport domain-containing protein n=1 Tax=Aduncisulcus paluster TaxID=2918883 RepID=A0ABQ5KL64_9EUKA|nr:hypothetical protein ADUPG1_007219 [Aduncisulcus paluster]
MKSNSVQPIFSVIPFILMITGMGLFGGLISTQQMAFWTIPALIGIIMQVCPFGFTGAFRRLYTGPDPTKILSLLVAMAICSAIAIPLCKKGVVNGISMYPSSANVTIFSLLGSIIFGFGMQTACSCASGTFVEAGQGRLYTGPDPTKILSLLVAMAICSAIAIPLCKKGVVNGISMYPSSANVTIFSLLGSIIFGFGMQTACSCASGTFVEAGQGSTKALLTLFFFCAGSVIAITFLPALDNTPHIKAGQLYDHMPAFLAVFIMWVIYAAIAVLVILVTKHLWNKRYGNGVCQFDWSWKDLIFPPKVQGKFAAPAWDESSLPCSCCPKPVIDEETGQDIGSQAVSEEHSDTACCVGSADPMCDIHCSCLNDKGCIKPVKHFPFFSPYVGGLLMGLCNAMLLLCTGSLWGCSGATLYWGSSFLYWLGVPMQNLKYYGGSTKSFTTPLWDNAGCVMDIGLAVGSAVGSCLVGTWGVMSRWLHWRECIGAIIGGLCLGIGSRWAHGCNVGNLFSGVSCGAWSGMVFTVGCAFGCWVGVLVRPWFGVSNEVFKHGEDRLALIKKQRLVGESDEDEEKTYH